MEENVFRNLEISKQEFLKYCITFYTRVCVIFYCIIFIFGNTILYGLTNTFLYSIIFVILLTLGLLQALDKRFEIMKRLNVVNTILSNPYLLRLIIRDKTVKERADVSNIPLKDFSNIDRRMVKNYSRYYKEFKFTIPAIIYAIISSYLILFCRVYNVSLSPIIYFGILSSYIIILTVYSICNIFKNVYIKMFYKSFTNETDKLFKQGYLTCLQFKAIYICNARYLDESVLSEDECKYIIKDNIVSKNDLAKDYLDFTFKYLSNSVILGLAIMGFLYIILKNKTGINLNYLIAWIVLLVVARYAVKLIYRFTLKYSDREPFVENIMRRMYKDEALLSNFILNRLPNEILEQL